MKKAVALALCLCLMAGLVPAAQAAGAATAQQAVRAMGIMVGDEKGNMNLSAPVTRAQFAKMMVAASPFKDSVGTGGGGVSPFSDVPHTHWAAEYIKTAVSAGYLTGYVDGTYRPDSTILLEEGAAALLRMLGYTAADLTGSWPSAQLSKYQALGLDEGVQCARGEALLRSDCMHLFYNLMTAQSKAGMLYGQSLGYTVSLSGEIDYAALVNMGLKGPYVAGDEALQAMVPFAVESAEVYRAGAASSAGSLQRHDVVYYHENLRTVWIYTDKAVGLLTAALPSGDTPSQVVVGGVTYAVGTASSAYKLSSMGPYRVGDTVTLLLGRNGEVVEVLDGTAGSGQWYGVITGKQDTTYIDHTGRQESVSVVDVHCTDGLLRQFSQDGLGEGLFTPGSAVSITVEKGEVAIRLASKALSGTVDSRGTKIGDIPLADGVHILDATRDGSAMPVYIDRLKGCGLSSSDVRFYALNSAGEIEHLILNNATGDMAVYGVITSVQESDLNLGDYGMQVGVYQYVVHGTAGTYASDTIRSFREGPVRLRLSGADIAAADPLAGHRLTELHDSHVTADNRRLELAAALQVYLVENGSYTLTQLSAVQNLERYRLTAYVDSGFALGGQVRVILAEKL